MDDFSILNDYIGEYGLVLDESQIDMFRDYYELLIEWNSHMNLTSITDFFDVIVKHFSDSLALIKYANLSGSTLIDVGTGAGFPGIPLKIAVPSCNITLMDSLNKRVSFLNEVIDKLSLKNITAIHSRAEDLAHDNRFRGQFDYSVSRAVSNLSTLSEYCLPFVKPGGFFVSYKSDNIEEEISSAKGAIKILGSSVDNVYEYKLPKTEYGRSLIFIKRTESIKEKYPRKAGVPLKMPLK